MALRAVTRADVSAACERLHALAGDRGVEAVACDGSTLAAEGAAGAGPARPAPVARRAGGPPKVRPAPPGVPGPRGLCGADHGPGGGAGGAPPPEPGPA